VWVQLGASLATKTCVSSNVVGLVNLTVMVTVPSPTADGPEYCHTLALTREKVYGAGSWFFHPRVSPWGVICTSPYEGVNPLAQSPVAVSLPGVGISQIDTAVGVKSLEVGRGLLVVVGVSVAVAGTTVSVAVADGRGVALGSAVAVGLSVFVGAVVGDGGCGEAVGGSVTMAAAVDSGAADCTQPANAMSIKPPSTQVKTPARQFAAIVTACLLGFTVPAGCRLEIIRYPPTPIKIDAACHNTRPFSKCPALRRRLAAYTIAFSLSRPGWEATC
jgi:hypothetical protein